MRFRRSFAVLATGIAIVALSSPGLASADPASHVPTDHVEVTTTLPDGTQLVSGWVSNAYLAAHPDAIPQPLGSAVQAAASADAVTPMSAQGCNQNVCINIVGSGLVVDSWETTAMNSKSMCTHALYDIYEPGNPVSGKEPSFSITGQKLCGEGAGVFYDYESAGKLNYPNHTHLCNAWVRQIISGYPCEEIHS
jgi:hypothetical protein